VTETQRAAEAFGNAGKERVAVRLLRVSDAVPSVDATGNRSIRIIEVVLAVIPPFLAGVGRRIHAAAFNFCAKGTLPMSRCLAMVWLQTMKGMFGQSLLQAHGHCVAKSWAARWPASDCLRSPGRSMVSMVSLMR
jgi:hypothetical protein